MSKNIYVGNLPFETTDASLGELFQPYGEVQSSRVITDRDTGRSRGFGFVEMSVEDADKAISALNGKEIEGRALTVNEARAKRDDRQGGGGGGGGGRSRSSW